MIVQIKEIMKIMLTKITILATAFLIQSRITFADPPGPPDPGGDPAGGGVPVGAPLDHGVMILLILGVSYVLWRFFSARKKNSRVDELISSSASLDAHP